MAKELSMNKLDKLLKDATRDHSSILHYGDTDAPIEIEIKYTISVNEMADLVIATVSNLFRENEAGDDVYCPEFYGASLAANILGNYTNLKENLGTDRLMQLMYGTDIYDDVVRKISQTQYADIVQAIDKRVQFLCGTMQAEQTAKLNKLAEQFDKAAAAFSTLNENFSSINPEVYRRAVENIGHMTAEDFVAPVLKLVGNDEHTT